jgi:serine/threonine-protein kinase RsbW
MGSETSPHPFRTSARAVRARRRGGVDSRRVNGAADVRLSLPARPENVAVIRHVLGAFAEALELPPEKVEDMRLAVTEACTNVVRHDYHDGQPGPIDVAIRPEGDALELVVSDRGRGMGPSPDVSGPGLGLPLIGTLADSVDIQHAPAHGSRVVMMFQTGR